MAGTLIVALDVDTRREAESIVNALDGTADFFKIGYQLFYGGDGLALGKELLAVGHQNHDAGNEQPSPRIPARHRRD